MDATIKPSDVKPAKVVKNTSKVVPVRLRADELKMLKFCCSSRDGDLNVSELFRMLLHREYSRRKTGTSVVKHNTISSEWRNGRPSEPGGE